VSSRPARMQSSTPFTVRRLGSVLSEAKGIRSVVDSEIGSRDIERRALTASCRIEADNVSADPGKISSFAPSMRGYADQRTIARGITRKLTTSWSYSLSECTSSGARLELQSMKSSSAASKYGRSDGCV
jgi:hypothetical protein